MKKHYDFSDAAQGKFHRPAESLRIPIYLEEDVQRSIAVVQQRRHVEVAKLVNTMLRSQLDLLDLLK